MRRPGSETTPRELRISGKAQRACHGANVPNLLQRQSFDHLTILCTGKKCKKAPLLAVLIFEVYRCISLRACAHRRVHKYNAYICQGTVLYHCDHKKSGTTKLGKVDLLHHSWIQNILEHSPNKSTANTMKKQGNVPIKRPNLKAFHLAPLHWVELVPVELKGTIHGLGRGTRTHKRRIKETARMAVTGRHYTGRSR